MRAHEIVDQASQPKKRYGSTEINETTTAGSVAVVATPLGQLQRRQPPRKKGKYRNSIT